MIAPAILGSCKVICHSGMRTNKGEIKNDTGLSINDVTVIKIIF